MTEPARVLPFRGRKTGIWTWGVPKLDNLIGPICPGRFYTVGARPSCGKTAVVMNLVDRITSKVLERPANELTGQPWRILAWFTERSRRVALKSLAALHCGLQEDPVMREAWAELPDGARDRVGDHYAILSDWWPAFVCMDRSNPTLDDLKRDLEEVSTRYKGTGNEPEILILDYLQRIKPSGREGLWDACGNVMQWFRHLAGEGKTIIVTSQMKRRGDGAMDKYWPPHLEDFLGGGLIEAATEIGLGLFRPLKKMTAQQMKDVRAGHDEIEKWWQPGVMAIKSLKHTYLGPAGEGMVWARVGKDRRIGPYDIEPPMGAGDAWEPDGDGPPF